MTELLMTRSLSLNSINQSNKHIFVAQINKILLSINLSSCFGFRKFEMKKGVPMSQCGEPAITFYWRLSRERLSQ